MVCRHSLLLLLFCLLAVFTFTESQDDDDFESDDKYTFIEPAKKLTPFQISFKRSRCKNLPPGADINDYRVYEKTGKCYSILFGQRGPCGPNMRFFEKPDDAALGICDCVSETDRTLIYHEKSKRCHYIFTYAYCKPGYWLTISETTVRPTCVKNPCETLQTRHPFEEYVPYNNRCVKLDSKVKECDDDEVIKFVKGRLLPKCSLDFGNNVEVSVPGVLKPVNKLRPCTPGSYRSLSGDCQANWVW